MGKFVALAVVVALAWWIIGYQRSTPEFQLDQRLDRAVAEAHEWSAGYGKPTGIDEADPKFVGGMIYMFCVLAPDYTGQEIEEMLQEEFDSADDLATWRAMKRIAFEHVC